MWWPFSASNTAVIAEKRAQRSRELANVATELIGGGIYLKATASEIVSRIEKGEWTASQVLEAYISRAALAQARTNCLTEIMFNWGRQQAADLDREFATTKKLRGPLHGVPVSFKDQFEISGYDASVGFSKWANKPATHNADLVEQLLAAGAVLYVKTNIPQTMFAFECSNPLWGRSTNPYNEKYTCGGSSGGEGALLAMDGSVLGVGSDIGGSLRIPAAYCGIYSLKPSTGRVSYVGARGPSPGFEGVKTVTGPLARSVEDLELFSRVTFGIQRHQNDVVPMPFRDITLPNKLRFGYYTSDGFAKASPANKRAVLETVEALRREGHECIEFEVPGVELSFETFVALTSADGYRTLLSHLGPDSKESALFLVTIGPKLPWFVRNTIAWALENLVGDKIFAASMRAARVKPVSEYMEWVVKRNKYIKDFSEKIWDKYNFDGIIAPVQALPQLPHGGCNYHSPIAIGTILFNMLDFPTGCLPVTRIDPAKDQITEEWRQEPGHGSKILESGLFDGKKALYDPAASEGMPVGIQIAAKKWEEEKVLAMMDVIDKALDTKRGFGPGAWDAFMKKMELK